MSKPGMDPSYQFVANTLTRLRRGFMGYLNESLRFLFVDRDLLSFQIRQCIARATMSLPATELFHASDTASAIKIFDSVQPDVIILDTQTLTDFTEIMDLHKEHSVPLVFLDTGTSKYWELQEMSRNEADGIAYVTKKNNLESLHDTLLVAASMAQRKIARDSGQELH